MAALQCAVNWKRIPAPVNDTFRLKIATLLPHSTRQGHGTTKPSRSLISSPLLCATQLQCRVPLLLLSASAGLCARLHLLVYSWRVPTTLFGCCPHRQHCQLAVRQLCSQSQSQYRSFSSWSWHRPGELGNRSKTRLSPWSREVVKLGVSAKGAWSASRDHCWGM